MAKTKISEFDTNPALNTDIDSINIAEGCAPSGINNAIRELMSQLKNQQSGTDGDNFTVGGNLVATGTLTADGLLYPATDGTSGQFLKTNGTGTLSFSGDLSSCTADGTNKVGYRNIPLSGIKTSTYNPVVGDVGKFIELGTGGSVTINSGVFSAGDVFMIINNTSATITCTCSAITTVYKAGTDADVSTFGITTRGIATVLFVTATVAIISGTIV
jgi:hypothetical protein